MKTWSCCALSLTALVASAGVASADMQGTADSGGWAKRIAVEPDPSKVVVPEGYEVGILVKGLSAPSSATVDADGNLWVAVSPPLLGSPDADQFEEPHVKVFDPQGKLIKEIGSGTFTTVMNEISFCPENGKTYVPEYAEKIWEVDGVNGEPKLIIKDLFIGDHRNGGITCKDGYLYFALGLPSNTGFADPDNHGWTDIPNDPFWLAHPDGHPATPHDPACRDIVHTGLNVKSSDGRLTGALPAGRRAGHARHEDQGEGAVRRLGHAGQVRTQPGADGIYPHDNMEVYAMGFRNQSGVAFGPAGSRFENALAVSDNGANDLGNRRVANGAEKIWLVTEMGQDAGFPDKEGFLFVSGKRFGQKAYTGNPIDRPYPNLYIGEEPVRARGVAVPLPAPCRGRARRAAHRRQSQPGRLHQPDPGVGHQQPDRRHRLERSAASAPTTTCSARSTASSTPARKAWSRPGRPCCRSTSWSPRGSSGRTSPATSRWAPTAYQKEENRGGLERPNDVVFSNDGKTMYIVDYGEVFTDFEMPSPFYTVPGSGVIWTVTYKG